MRQDRFAFPQFSKSALAQGFWHWSDKNAVMLHDFERGRGAAFRVLSAGLAKISDERQFECGSRERMLGVDGLGAALPLVEALMGEAPRLAL